MICRTHGAIRPHPPPNLPLEGGGTWLRQHQGACVFNPNLPLEGGGTWLPPLQGEGWGGDGAAFGFGIVKHCIRHFIRDATLAACRRPTIRPRQ